MILITNNIYCHYFSDFILPCPKSVGIYSYDIKVREYVRSNH